ncbi:MAG TPA: hypothetical protein VGG74_10270 [Kofleriaceae bacterium]|jgi:hypothetical protein
MTDAERDELRRLGERLRAVFAAERAAIASLDHAALATVHGEKQQLVGELGRAGSAASKDPELRALFQTLRVEAHATALLANHARAAVDALLGRESAGYDRRANRTMIASSALRGLRAY